MTGLSILLHKAIAMTYDLCRPEKWVVDAMHNAPAHPCSGKGIMDRNDSPQREGSSMHAPCISLAERPLAHAHAYSDHDTHNIQIR